MYASLWYGNLKNKRHKERKPRLCSWEALKTRLKKRFFPSDFIQDYMYLKLKSLKQNSLTVKEYVVEFEKLSMMCDLKERTEHKIARFITGLDNSLPRRWIFGHIGRLRMFTR